VNNNTCLITLTNGQLLAVSDNELTSRKWADDSCMWIQQGEQFQSASGDFSLDASELKALELDGESLLEVRPGPCRLPSELLEELQRTGMTVVENVLDAAATSRIKERAAKQRAKHHADEDPYDGHFWMMSSLLWSADVARASSHPVALWLIQQYMKTEAIHFCHQPVMTTLKPAKAYIGNYPEGGWHSDYPYHPGVFPDEDWPESPPLGVQFNTCIDPFEPETAGTQYIPGSHLRGSWPPAEMNLGGTHVGKGLHKDVKQIVAPAGAAVLYDARTWHRACHELNVSGKDRIALLNAVAPAWVLPMMDKEPIAKIYPDSETPAQLTERERDDINRLCHSQTQPVPDDMPDLQVRLAAR